MKEQPQGNFQDFGWKRKGRQLNRLLNSSDEIPTPFQRKDTFYYYLDEKGRLFRMSKSKIEATGLPPEKYFDGPSIKRWWSEEALTLRAV
jgi:hypothetical protein